MQPDMDVDLMDLDAQFKFLYKKHWNHYRGIMMCTCSLLIPLFRSTPKRTLTQKTILPLSAFL